MKRIFNLCVLAVAAIVSFSCAKEIVDNNNFATEGTVTFNAVPVPETRTVFGELSENKYPTLWTNAQKVAISLNFATPKDATVIPSGNQKSASLQADFADDGSGSYTFYALSPRAAYQGSIEENRIGFAIPTSQTPLTGSVDEGAMILAAKSSTLGEFPTSAVNLAFSHVTAYACLTLKNLVDLGGETINSIAITAGDNIAGRWYYYTNTGTIDEWASSATITVNTSSTSNIMFAMAPVDLAGKSFKVVVNTTGGTVTKQITWPSGKAFIAGHVAKFNINMSGAILETPKVYNLVTDISELTSNSKVIIVGAETNTAISTNQQANNRADAAVTKVGTTITDPADNVEVFTIEAGTKSNTYAFKATTEAGYIYAASSSGNHLKTEATKSANSSFAITINETSGEATVVAQGTNTKNHVRHNASSTCFSCYAESSSITEKVAIYKLDGSGDPVLPKVSIANDIEAIVDDDDIVITWTDPVDVNVDHYEVTCTGQASQNVDPSDGGFIFENLSNGSYTVTVTAVAANLSTHRNSSTWNSSLLNVSTGGGSGVPSLQYTLTPASGSNNGYANNCDITINGITWNLTGNSTFQPWRIGGKSLSGVDRELYSKTALNKSITSIEITHGAASSINVNSMTVIVSKNADFSSPVSTLTPSFVANGTVTVDRPDGKDWSNCYYKIVYNVTVSGTSNKFVEFSEAKFYGTN